MAGKSKAKSGPRFFRLESRLVQSPGHRALSFVARVVLQELMAQYNGENNGDLSATRTMAKDWGIGSDNTLRSALKELEASNWIVQTRCSVFNKHGARCALYALSWLPIDECPGKELEVLPRRTPIHPLPTLLNSISSCAVSAH